MRPFEYYLTLITNLFCLMVVFFYTDGIIEELHYTNAAFMHKITELEIENAELKKGTLKYKVTATMYEPVRSQTDSDPHITADGTRINIRHAGKYRYCAVSRDLLRRWGGSLEYGDYIMVSGINGKYDGVWQIKDTMNARWDKRIDLLCDPGTKPFKADDVIIEVPA